jgi:hypothetical protein
MLHDRNTGTDEISLYAQKYDLSTGKEAEQMLKFISNPLYRSYIFTYDIGYELLEELFARGDREQYFARILREPITPTQIRAWMTQL